MQDIKIMNKACLIFGILILIISCKSIVSINDNKDVLFNGKDLNGWTILGKEKWYVKDHLLVCETVSKKDFGYLVTDKKYKDFELNFEFKYETIKGNSGVFLHSNFEGGKTTGWQIEIGPPGHKSGGIHKYGKGWLATPDKSKDSIVDMKQWNTMKIQLKEDKLTSWLNGIKMATIIDSELKSTTGTIALQIRDNNAKIQWRNIEITEF